MMDIREYNKRIRQPGENRSVMSTSMSDLFSGLCLAVAKAALLIPVAFIFCWVLDGAKWDLVNFPIISFGILVLYCWLHITADYANEDHDTYMVNEFLSVQYEFEKIQKELKEIKERLEEKN